MSNCAIPSFGLKILSHGLLIRSLLSQLVPSISVIRCVGFTIHSLNFNIQQSYSRERINNPWERITNPGERIEHFIMTFYL